MTSYTRAMLSASSSISSARAFAPARVAKRASATRGPVKVCIVVGRVARARERRDVFRWCSRSRRG